MSDTDVDDDDDTADDIVDSSDDETQTDEGVPTENEDGDTNVPEAIPGSNEDQDTVSIGREDPSNDYIPNPQNQDGEADVYEDGKDPGASGEADVPEAEGTGKNKNANVPGVGMVNWSFGQLGKFLHESFDNLMDTDFGDIANAHANDRTAVDPSQPTVRGGNMGQTDPQMEKFFKDYPDLAPGSALNQIPGSQWTGRAVPGSFVPNSNATAEDIQNINKYDQLAAQGGNSGGSAPQQQPTDQSGATRSLQQPTTPPSQDQGTAGTEPTGDHILSGAPGSAPPPNQGAFPDIQTAPVQNFNTQQDPRYPPANVDSLGGANAHTDPNNPNTWGKSAPWIVREAINQGTVDKLPGSVLQAAGVTRDPRTGQLHIPSGPNLLNPDPKMQYDPSNLNDPLNPQNPENDSPAKHLLPPDPSQRQVYKDTTQMPPGYDPNYRRYVDGLRQYGYTDGQIYNQVGPDGLAKAGYKAGRDGAQGGRIVLQQIPPTVIHNNVTPQRYDNLGPGGQSAIDQNKVGASAPTDITYAQYGKGAGQPYVNQPVQDMLDRERAQAQAQAKGPGGANEPMIPVRVSPNITRLVPQSQMQQQTGLTADQYRQMNQFRDRKGNVAPSIAKQILGSGQPGVNKNQWQIDKANADRASRAIDDWARIRQQKGEENPWDGLPRSTWKSSGRTPPIGTKFDDGSVQGRSGAPPSSGNQQQVQQQISRIPRAAITAMQNGTLPRDVFDRTYGPLVGMTNPSAYVQ